MPNMEQQLVELESRFQDDGIAYLLIQFVDIHGAPKVKLVPASCLRSVATAGAGFAGGAVWGMGQGPHSHDLQARADLASYTSCRTSRASRGSPRTFMSTASRIPYCPRVNLESGARGGARPRDISSTSASSPNSFWSSKTPTARSAAGTLHEVDRPVEGMLRLQGHVRRTRISCAS